jgi:hypothetical protein
MKAYLFDENTKEFEGLVDCQIDPLESEKQGKKIWLLPANSTLVEPLEPKEGYLIVFNGEFWEYQEIEKPSEEEKEPTNEDISNMRQNAYMMRTDPLTLRKLRKQALGEWTTEDEKEYVAQIQAISAQIASEFPYNSEEPSLGA